MNWKNKRKETREGDESIIQKEKVKEEEKEYLIKNAIVGVEGDEMVITTIIGWRNVAIWTSGT